MNKFFITLSLTLAASSSNLTFSSEATSSKQRMQEARRDFKHGAHKVDQNHKGRTCEMAVDQKKKCEIKEMNNESETAADDVTESAD